MRQNNSIVGLILLTFAGCGSTATEVRECSSGSGYRCSDGHVERCTSGHWEFVESCGDGQSCREGVCVSGPQSVSCDHDSDCAANESCIQRTCKSTVVGQFTITGQVVDFQTGRGIAGATVKLLDGRATEDTTDSNGRYTIASISEGQYGIQFRKSSYWNYGASIAVLGANKEYSPAMYPRARSAQVSIELSNGRNYSGRRVDFSRNDPEHTLRPDLGVVVCYNITYPDTACIRFNELRLYVTGIGAAPGRVTGVTARLGINNPGFQIPYSVRSETARDGASHAYVVELDGSNIVMPCSSGCRSELSIRRISGELYGVGYYPPFFDGE